LKSLSIEDLLRAMGEKVKETDEFLEFCQKIIMDTPEFKEFVESRGKKLEYKYHLKELT